MKALVWWIYLLAGVILFFFVAPSQVSAKDTSIVMLALLEIALYGFWSWNLWGVRLFNYAKGELK